MYSGDLLALRLLLLCHQWRFYWRLGTGGGDVAQERVNTVYKGTLKLADQ